jgi:hypothetical protein
MMRRLRPDKERATLATAAVIALAFPSAWGRPAPEKVGAIALGALVGITLLRTVAPADHVSLPLTVSRTAGAAALVLFFVLLIGLPLLASQTASQPVAFNRHWRRFAPFPTNEPPLNREGADPTWRAIPRRRMCTRPRGWS